MRAVTIPYDSDHAAISLTFEFPNDLVPMGAPNAGDHRFNFKATDWSLFTQKLADLYPGGITSTRNLSIAEIESFLHTLSNTISTAVHECVPEFSITDNTRKFLNNKIRKLQKHKKFIVSLLHDHHIFDPRATLRLTRIAKALHKDLVFALQHEFKISVDSFWSNLIKKINFRRPENFFLKINAIFRPKGRLGISVLRVPQDNAPLLARSSCEHANAHLLVDNCYAFSAPLDKLNIMGSYYESINSPRYLNSGTRLKELVDASVGSFVQDRARRRELGNTITTFSADSPATDPSPTLDPTHPFCSPPPRWL